MSVYGTVAKRKLALVIGTNYSSSADYNVHLNNAEDDANSIAQMLEKMGFEVDTLIGDDVDRTEMEEAIDSFADKLDRNCISVFFFSGHGFQWSYNHQLFIVLVPLLRKKLRSHIDVATKLINTDYLQSKFEEKGCLMNLIILDACRGPPPLSYILEEKNLVAARSSVISVGPSSFNSYDASGASSPSSSPSPSSILAAPNIGPTRSLSSKSASYSHPTTLFFFACEPGSVASDGMPGSGHGVFTKHLLTHLSTPQLSLTKLIARVSDQVASETRHRQRPYFSGMLCESEIFLVLGEKNQNPENGAGSSSSCCGAEPDVSRQETEEERELKRIPTADEVAKKIDELFCELNFGTCVETQELIDVDGYVPIFNFIHHSKFMPIRKRIAYALQNQQDNGWTPPTIKHNKLKDIVTEYDYVAEMNEEETASFALVQEALMSDFSEVVSVSPNLLHLRKLPQILRVLRLLEWILVGISSDRGGAGRSARFASMIGNPFGSTPSPSSASPSSSSASPASPIPFAVLPSPAPSSPVLRSVTLLQRPQQQQQLAVASNPATAADMITSMRIRLNNGESIQLSEPLKASAELRALCSFGRNPVQQLALCLEERGSMLLIMSEDKMSVKRKPLQQAIQEQVEFWMKDYENDAFLGKIAATSSPINTIPISSFVSFPRFQQFPPLGSLSTIEEKVALIRDAMMSSEKFEIISNGQSLQRRGGGIPFVNPVSVSVSAAASSSLSSKRPSAELSSGSPCRNRSRSRSSSPVRSDDSHHHDLHVMVPRNDMESAPIREMDMQQQQQQQQVDNVENPPSKRQHNK